MMPEKDRRFLPVADRVDMRVILAAELGRFGTEKKLISTMDEMVAAGGADVLISDDNDELVMLRMDGDCYVVVTETGFLRVEPRRNSLALQTCERKAVSSERRPFSFRVADSAVL